MKLTIYILLFFAFVLPSFGQQKYLKEANESFNNFAYINSISLYEKVIEKGFTSKEVLQKLGDSYYFNSKYSDASKWYKQLFELGDPVTSEYYFRYGQSLKSLGKYSEANIWITKFRKLERIKQSPNETDYLEEIKEISNRYEVSSLDKINSSYSEFSPFAKDGKLIFTSSKEGQGKEKYNATEEPFLDLFIVDINESGDPVGTPVPLQGKVNSNYHDSNAVVTKDGNTMYFTSNKESGKKIKKDNNIPAKLNIYRATKVNGSWENIERLPFNGKTYSIAHPALSPNGNFLYFSSDMPGSIGGSDIWEVAIFADGSFDAVRNLGENINTVHSELFPFIATSGNLYFSSNGHDGLGGLDVYVARNIGSGNFTNVLNVGTPVNSSFDDFSFSINEATKIGYFASNNTKDKNDNIYKFIEKVPVENFFDKSVEGVINDSQTGKPIQFSSVNVYDKNKKLLKKVYTNKDGKFSFDTKKGEIVFVRAEGSSYLTDEVLLDANTKDIELKLSKKVIQLGKGDDIAKVILNPIYFANNSSIINTDAKFELTKILVVLESNPNTRIEVRSHTDSKGKEEYNLNLSSKRAKATINYLIKNGIPANRIQSKGFGESQLINNCANNVNCSEEKHQENRRSEFIIIN